MIEKTKVFLKKSRILSYINATYKCKKLKKLYASFVERYADKPLTASLEKLLLDKGFTSKWANELSKKRLHIYFIGTDESQDKSGFIQDLGKFGKLDYFVRENGQYGQYMGLQTYDGQKGRELNTTQVIASLQRLIDKGEKPDLIFMQAWGFSFDIDRMIAFKKKHDLKFLNICLDDRLVFEAPTPKSEKYNNGISGLIPLVDLMLVANPEVVDWYLKENMPAIFFPMASSLEVYHPMDIEKKYDVGFIGNKYGYREELIDALTKAGINVEARGTGWPAGRIQYKDNNAFFNQCKIVLGIGTVGHCKDFYTQKLRDFDATLSGAVYVTHNNRDLTMFFEKDKEIVLCDNINDYIKKIKRLLQDEAKMKEIAQNAYFKAKEQHTYEKRFADLFQLLGIKKGVEV